MMAMSPMQANAQDVQPQGIDSVQTVSQQPETLGDVLRARGASKKEIKSLGKVNNPSNLMLRNSRGENNVPIRQFLSTLRNMSSSMSTKNIKIFSQNEFDIQSKFLSKINIKKAEKYKLFNLNDGTVLMPINYTIQDVQNELQPNNVFQLGDFDIQ